MTLKRKHEFKTHAIVLSFYVENLEALTYLQELASVNSGPRPRLVHLSLADSTTHACDNQPIDRSKTFIWTTALYMPPGTIARLHSGRPTVCTEARRASYMDRLHFEDSQSDALTAAFGHVTCVHTRVSLQTTQAVRPALHDHWCSTPAVVCVSFT